MNDAELLLIDLSPPTADVVECVVRIGRSSDLGPRRWRAEHSVDQAAVRRELSALSATRNAVVQRTADADSLRSHGALLFDLLLPPAVKAAIRARSGGPLIIGGWPQIPWPVVHDGRGVLGQRFDLGEARTGGPRLDAPPEMHDRLLVLADPADDLPAARAEGQALAAVIGSAANPPAYDLRLGRQSQAGLLRALRRYRIVHYAGHVDPPARGGGWRLVDGHLDARTIELLRGGPVPRLVFTNACRSLGATGDALLAAGVRHLIGTDLDLPDLQGADFARDVYRALFAGRTLGAALRGARIRAAERGDPVWTAYRLLGDPRTRYAEPDSDRQAELRRAVAVAIRRPMPDELDARVDAIRAWRRVIDATVSPAGGRLLPASGQITRVVFGVPARREDDVRRAAEVALALGHRAPDAVVALESGRLAVAGDELLGGPLDATEASCWALTPGVHLGPAAARALRGVARCEGDRLLAIEARARPAGPLIGRSDELTRIDRIAERAHDGRGASLSVLGPAGIGKSRLLDAAETHLSRRSRVVRATGDAGGPFGAIERVVRVVCGVDADDPPEQARRRIERALERRRGADDFLSIDDLLGERDATTDGETRRRHADALSAIIGVADVDRASPAAIVPAIRAMIEAAVDERPLTLMIEDAHHAPDTALAIIAALVDDPPPVLLVTTDRPDGPLADHPASARHHRLELAPLPAPAARALIAALRPETPRAAVDALVARAEGNPLFIHELARHRPEAAEALPESIEALMQARLDRLGAADRELLRAAAVLGRTFWQAGVGRMVGRPSIEADLERLAGDRFVAREPRSALPDQIQWRFEHGLLHAAVAESLPRQRRAALHGRAALWLADELPPPAGPRAADIAHHREASGDLGRAVTDWLAAADHAEATLAPEAASRALEAAERLLPAIGATAERRAMVQARLGALDQLAGRLDRAAQRLTAALSDTPASADRARRLARLGAVQLARGETAAARAAVDAAVEALAAVDRPTSAARTEVAYQAAWTDYHQGDLDRAQARLEALLAALPEGAEQDRGMAWRLMGTIAQQRGDADGARYWLERALGALRDDVERARVLHGLALVAVQRGEYDAAAAHYAQTVRIRARLGDRAGLARTYSNLGTLCGERGDFTRAERYLREAIRIRTRLGHGSLAISHANLVELYLRQGRPEAARAELERVTALLDAGQAPSWARSELWRIIADVKLRSDELPAAEIAAGRAIAVAEEMGDPLRVASGLEVRARIAAARQAIDDAIEAFESAIGIYEDHEATGSLVLVLDQLAALVEDHDPERAAALRRERAQVQSLDV